MIRKCISIVEKTVGRSLIDDGFHNIKVPYNTVSENHTSAFLYRKT